MASDRPRLDLDDLEQEFEAKTVAGKAAAQTGGEEIDLSDLTAPIAAPAGARVKPAQVVTAKSIMARSPTSSHDVLDLYDDDRTTLDPRAEPTYEDGAQTIVRAGCQSSA